MRLWTEFGNELVGSMIDCFTRPDIWIGILAAFIFAAMEFGMEWNYESLSETLTVLGIMMVMNKFGEETRIELKKMFLKPA